MSLKYEPALELQASWDKRPVWYWSDHFAGLSSLLASLSVLVRIHFIIVMIRWTGLAPWESEFLFPGSLASTFLTRGAGAVAANSCRLHVPPSRCNKCLCFKGS